MTARYTGTVESVTGNAPFKYLVRWDGDDRWGTTDWHWADVLEPIIEDGRTPRLQR